jgi:hypothetical protein
MWFNLTRMLCFGWLYLFYIILLVSCNTESSFRWIEPYVSIVYEVTNKWWRERKTSPWEANSVSNRQPGNFGLIICPAQLLLPPTSQPYLFLISNFLSPHFSPLLSRSTDNSDSSSSAVHRGSLGLNLRALAPCRWEATLGPGCKTLIFDLEIQINLIDLIIGSIRFYLNLSCS